MTKYVLTYYGGSGMPETEEEQQQLMAEWGAWFGQIGDNLVDGGNPFAAVASVAPDGSTSHTGVVDNLNGYSVINAADLDSAIATAKGCPVLKGGGSVQVSEAIEM